MHHVQLLLEMKNKKFHTMDTRVGFDLFNKLVYIRYFCPVSDIKINLL